MTPYADRKPVALTMAEKRIQIIINFRLLAIINPMIILVES